MEDTGGLLLNLTSSKETNKRRGTAVNRSVEDVPLIRFVSNKTPKSTSEDNLPKIKTISAPKVLRRKAFGSKKLSETLSKPVTAPKPAPVQISNASSKQLPNKKGKQTLNSQKKGKKSEQPTVISSLFRKNPEIPTIEKKSVEVTDEKVFSSNSFSSLNIHDHLKATLEKELGLTQMTEVQCLTIPVLLQRKDALVKSQTGSGKTLAYAIPIVQSLQAIRPKITRTSGIFALIIVPTRELVLQTYSWFVKIVKAFTWVVPGYLIGGEKKKSEKARIRKGINILISTPGRLLDHINSTQNLNLGRLNWLVMDEADRMLDMGYEKDVAKIISTVNEHFEREGGIGKKQTIMLSATLSAGVEKLAGFTLTNPECINVSKEADASTEKLVTPSQLKQHYILIPPKLRLVTLAAFVLWKCTKRKRFWFS